MKYHIYLRLLVLTLPFALGACGLTDWANTHMPVIGERCENWQCFTESGQEQSKLNEQERLHPQQNPYSSPLTPTDAPAGTPGGTAAAPTAPAQPLAPPMPEEGAYKYVPRAPAASGTTPFEGQ